MLFACVVGLSLVGATWCAAASYTNNYPGRSFGVTCQGNAALDAKGNVTSCAIAQNAGYTNVFPGKSMGVSCRGGSSIRFDAKSNVSC